MGFGVVQQQTLTAGQEFCAMAIGQESEGADTDKAAGKNMQQETSQELLRGERHHSLGITVCIVLPAEGNLVMLEGHETVVGNGHPMGVAGEIKGMEDMSIEGIWYGGVVQMVERMSRRRPRVRVRRSRHLRSPKPFLIDCGHSVALPFESVSHN
jgi:hypothetical protein